MWFVKNKQPLEHAQEEREEEAKKERIAVELFEIRRECAKEVSDLRIAYEDRDAERVARIADLEKQISDLREDVEIARASSAAWEDGFNRLENRIMHPEKVN